MAEETAEDRSDRLRDDFEGWSRDRAEEWSDNEQEADDVEVGKRRDEREGKESSALSKSWGDWWEKQM